MKLHHMKLLRKVLLPIFRVINLGDITVKHARTGHKMLLHSFNHKGYWYSGKNREKESMELYESLIKSGDQVIEVGGHIGFVSLFFSTLVGDNGFVYVFEPGSNNIKYIKENIKQVNNIELVEKAVTDYSGTVSFYTENLTGQNNSLISDFSVLDDNVKSQNINNIKRTKETVSCVSLFDFVSNTVNPDFIKIDVEGAELNVLTGMKDLLSKDIILMVEVTENKKEVFDMLIENDYNLFSPDKLAISHYDELLGDTFAIKKSNDLFHTVFSKS